MANESVARALEDLKVGLSESFHDTDLDLLRLNRLDSRQNLEAVSRETLQNFKLHDVLIDLIIKAQIQDEERDSKKQKTMANQKDPDWVESPFAKSLHSQGLRPRQTFVPPGPMPTAEEDEDDEASEQQGGTACVKPNEGVSSSTPPQAEDIEVGSHHIFSKSLKRRRIYIRACYVAIFNLIWAHYSDLSKVSKWEWVLTGLPGLGKTVWIIFAIASSLQKQSIISVFVQLKKGKTWEISRTHQRLHRCDPDCIPDLLLPRPHEIQHVVLIDAVDPETDGVNCPIVLVSSPRQSILKDFSKQTYNREDKIHMAMWSPEEIALADSYQPGTGASIEETAEVYGWKARELLPPPNQPRSACLEPLETAIKDKDVAKLVSSLPGKDLIMPDEVSHALLSYELDERTWKIVSYNFASDVARKLCVEALRKKSWIGIKGLLRAATMNHMLGKSLASVCLEDFMFDSIASRADFPHRHLGELKQGAMFPGFPVAVCDDFFKTGRFGNPQPGMLHRPSSLRYCAVNAISCPRTLYQVTCSLEHPEKAHGLMQACKDLDSNMLRKLKAINVGVDDAYIHLVFLVQQEIFTEFEEQPVGISLTKGGTPSKSWQQKLILDRVQQWVVGIEI